MRSPGASSVIRVRFIGRTDQRVSDARVEEAGKAATRAQERAEAAQEREHDAGERLKMMLARMRRSPRRTR